MKNLILLSLLNVCSLVVFARELPVHCEFPSSEGILSEPLGKMQGALHNGFFVIDNEEYAANYFKCERLKAFNPRYKARPSLVAYDAGFTSRAYHAVAPRALESEYEAYLAHSQENPLERDPSRAMTVFLHGTCSNHFDDLENQTTFPDYDPHAMAEGGGELLSYLGKILDRNGGQNGVHFMHLPGPASGNVHVTTLHDSFMKAQAYHLNSGLAFGSGVQENIEHVKLHLKGQTKNPTNMKFMAAHGDKLRKIGRLLIFGWSRGAVTAINLAHDLYRDPELKGIEIYMFLVDPVPGLEAYNLGWWKNIDRLYPNVKLCQLHFARNERSFGFSGIVPEEYGADGKRTGKNLNREIVMWPGNHSTLVGNIHLSKDLRSAIDHDLVPVPRMIRGLGQVFLKTFGAPLEYIEYHAGYDIPDIRPELQKDFQRLLDPAVQKKFLAMENESYLGVRQILGQHRKFFVEYARGAFDETQISGFYYRHDFKEQNPQTKTRQFINRLHRLLSAGKVGPRTWELFFLKLVEHRDVATF